MKKFIKYVPVTIIAMVALVFIVGSTVHVAKANPSLFERKQLSTATTTKTYMSAGAATTTLTFDFGAGTSRAGDGVALLEQFTGSSTLSMLNTDIQYSQDGIDWYAVGLTSYLDVNSGFASTSPGIGIIEQFNFAFASSTINRQATDASTTPANQVATRILMLQVPTRYIRAIFTIPAGSQAGAVWAEFVLRKQAP